MQLEAKLADLVEMPRRMRNTILRGASGTAGVSKVMLGNEAMLIAGASSSDARLDMAQATA
jgi:hypothetical protein